MPDLDAYRAGGSTGAMSRAAQLSALAASNAAARAAALQRVPVPGRAFPSFDARENQPIFSQPVPPPPVVNWADGFRTNPPAPPSVATPTATPGPESFRNVGFADRHENRQDNTGQPYKLPEKSPGQKGLESNYRAFLHDQEGAGNVQSGGRVYNSTIRSMLDDIQNDPIPNSDRKLAAQDMATAFQDASHFRIFSKDEVTDNPVVRQLNDLAAWSKYRKMVSDWHTGKRKVTGAPAAQAGDGTVATMVEPDSFASDTSPSAVPPYVVARDEHGLLVVERTQDWIDGKYTDMKADPRFAAQVITALATTSMYGTDSTANSQMSRVALDRNGNPVKALTGDEDRAALTKLALSAAIWQSHGDESAIDDTLAQLTRVGQDVSKRNAANGEHAGGGGGGRGGFGGGGSRVTRFTDPTQLAALVDSVGQKQMGRGLRPDEQQQFINYFHQLETTAQAAANAGQPYTVLDPQGQAVAWLQNHFKVESNANDAGQLAAQFAAMMGSTNPFAGI